MSITAVRWTLPGITRLVLSATRASPLIANVRSSQKLVPLDIRIPWATLCAWACR